MPSIITKLFGSKHDRDVKKINPQVDEINQIYQQLHLLSDDDLRARVVEFKSTIHHAVEEVTVELEDLRRILK